MARYSRAWFPLLLLASALVQSSYGSRPSPPEPKEPVAVFPVVHGAAEPRLRGDGAPEVQPSTEKGAAGHHGASAGDGGAFAASGMGGGGAVSSEQRKGSGAPVLQQALKVARRMLGGEAEDSAAGPSCHSNNAHITCAPPARH
ncbi:uncharacterized protein LOC123448248 [Hordeum vulgare subsp. vulgare]|uniref:uncharacterized protein LOC123448248 n=1 Tax=Hordeum vulgare subsp. vulgare TaxID=112509 RepID=UPI001B858E92|nr:uncharacterized protein LOC123448248 [Hordeum vulgare subsp. vulgare]